MKQHVLKKFDEVEVLFNEKAIIPSDFLSYNQSYKVGTVDITDMDFYHFDFEPYISLATSLGMSCFGIQGTENRFYLTHTWTAMHRQSCKFRTVKRFDLFGKYECRLLSKFGIECGAYRST